MKASEKKPSALNPEAAWPFPKKVAADKKHPDCEDRCQLREHKGYHSCSQTGRCAWQEDSDADNIGGNRV